MEDFKDNEPLKEKIVALQMPSQYITNRTKLHLLTDALAAKLEFAFKTGHTKKSACNYAGISVETYDKWVHKYPMFAVHMDMAQEYLKDKALKTVSYYLDNKDPDMAKWYLERKYNKEYSKNPEVAIQNNSYNVDFILDDGKE